MRIKSFSIQRESLNKSGISDGKYVYHNGCFSNRGITSEELLRSFCEVLLNLYFAEVKDGEDDV